MACELSATSPSSLVDRGAPCPTLELRSNRLDFTDGLAQRFARPQVLRAEIFLPPSPRPDEPSDPPPHGRETRRGITVCSAKMSPDTEDRAAKTLQERCGRWTIVELTEERRFQVFDVAWGRDMGDTIDHITTNISPGPKEPHSIDFFFTSDVIRIVDPVSGEVLYQNEKIA